MTDQRGERPHDHGIKDTAESIVIALILAFVFRAYVVEAFVIPTGSMAPTLLGAHHTIRCRACGYELDVDPGKRGRQRARAICPMCHFPNPVPEAAPLAGDRILVLKFLYGLQGPRRWDPIVFKNPEKPRVNYIKRLAGLPNERLAIVRGNVYVRPVDAAGSATGEWRIARKTARPAVQRAVFQPVYDSRYLPLDGGEGTTARQNPLGADFVWRRPWVPESPDRWRFARHGYTLHGDRGILRFDFDRIQRRRLQWQPYNQLKRRELPPQPPRELRIAASVRPLAESAGVTITTTGRFDATDGARQRLEARIEPDGRVRILLRRRDADATRVVASGRVEPLSADAARRIALWSVDQAAILWVDGEAAARWQYDVGLETLLERPPFPGPPRVSIRLSSAARLHRVRIDRDISYTRLNGNGREARGALWTDREGRRRGDPVRLGANAFFCLGDNSPMSEDSRFWSEPAPWVRDRMFDGAPAAGRVPRRLLIGRAFFVYFPPVHRLRPDHRWGVPNFGDMRVIH